MKILYIAVHSHVGWGAEYWLEKSFSQKGIECIKFDYRKKRKKLKFWSLINLNLKVVEKKEKPDIILLQRADHMPASTLKGLRTPIVFWSTEPIQLKNDVDQLLEKDIFSWVFVHSYSCLDRIKSEFNHHLPHCSIMHNACPESIIDEDAQKEEFALFNRTMSPRRHQWLDPSKEMIDFISGRYGDEYFEDLAKYMIAPNVHFSDENADDFESGIFEAMAKGCVIVSEKLNPKTIKDLEIEDSIIEVSTPEELNQKLISLKNDSELVEQYRKKSYKVIKHNTWSNRVDLFIGKFKDILN